MKLFRSAAVSALSAILIAPLIAQTQPPPPPKPGPEHQLFKMDAGTWDAVIEFTPGPGAPPMTSKGVEVNTIGCGGLCLISDFKGEAMPGVPFHGHGIVAWDPAKKKYVGSWTDSMSQGLMVGESTWDPAMKKMSGWMEGPDMTGTVVKSRSVGEYGPGGTRVFTAYAPGPDGKEMQLMKISYTARK
jgi:Protein of unknown function (DUF1579)